MMQVYVFRDKIHKVCLLLSNDSANSNNSNDNNNKWYKHVPKFQEDINLLRLRKVNVGSIHYVLTFYTLENCD